MNIQKTLDSLQPYIIGIRYLDGRPLVDVVFKDDWIVIDDKNIQKVMGNGKVNYYMIFTEVPGIGVDELLNYVDRVINLNLDREKKHELLKTKINELKEIFKNNTLYVLNKLKFNFSEDDLIPKLNELDVDVITETDGNIITNTQSEYDETDIVPEPLIESVTPKKILTTEPIVYLDENKQPIRLSEEEQELYEEELRAEKNLKLFSRNKKAKKVDSPQKQKSEMVMVNDDIGYGDCECGPNEACSKCIDSKSY